MNIGNILYIVVCAIIFIFILQQINLIQKGRVGVIRNFMRGESLIGTPKTSFEIHGPRGEVSYAGIEGHGYGSGLSEGKVIKFWLSLGIVTIKGVSFAKQNRDETMSVGERWHIYRRLTKYLILPEDEKVRFAEDNPDI